jgi:hypothetical protein
VRWGGEVKKTNGGTIYFEAHKESKEIVITMQNNFANVAILALDELEAKNFYNALVEKMHEMGW